LYKFVIYITFYDYFCSNYKLNQKPQHIFYLRILARFSLCRWRI